MRILFMTSAKGSLTRRLSIELMRLGDTIAMCVAAAAEGLLRAVIEHHPALFVAPMFKTAIPEQMWRCRASLFAARESRGGVADWQRSSATP